MQFPISPLNAVCMQTAFTVPHTSSSAYPAELWCLLRQMLSLMHGISANDSNVVLHRGHGLPHLLLLLGGPFHIHAAHQLAAGTKNA